MADEVVYRLIAGEGITLTEEAGTRTVTVSVPGLAQKINNGDIGLASTATAGLIEIATDGEVQEMVRDDLALTPGGLGAAAQASQYDTTPNRIMLVGAFGRGATLLAAETVNLNSLVAEGLYYINGLASSNLPFSNVSGWLEVAPSSDTNFIMQRFVSAQSSPAIAYRTKFAGVWGGWVGGWTSANFDAATKANTSGSYPGLSVGSAAQLNGQTDTMLAPPGQRGEFFTPTAPTGWLKANGAAVSRATYARLFSAIGTFFGAGNGSTTFNLPDDRGLFSRAWDDGAGIDTGRVFGSYQADELRLHGHHLRGWAGDPNNAPGPGGTTDVGTAAAGGDFTDETGGSETRPKNRAVLVCIKY